MSKALAANFNSSNELLRAVKKIAKTGVKKFDVFTPYPVHGLDEPMGIGFSPLPWVSLIAGLAGAGAGLLLQWWTHAISFPLNIAGKPLFSWPAYIPITFELGILLCGLATFGAIFAFCGLPKFASPLENDAASARSTDDQFMVYIEAKDLKFNETELKNIFNECHGQDVRWIGGSLA